MKRIIILVAYLFGSLTLLNAQTFPLHPFKNSEGKYGFRDRYEEVAIEPQWKEVNTHFVKKEDIVYVKDFNDLYGFIDYTGKLVVPCKWKKASIYREELVAVCDENDKYGFIDREGKTVIPFQYSNALWFAEGLAAVMNEKGEWGFIDKTGFLVIQYQFNGKAMSFSDGLANVAVKDPKNGKLKWGYIDKTGNVIVPLEWDDAFSYYKNLGKATVKKGAQSQDITISGEFPTTEEAIAMAKSGKKPKKQSTMASVASVAPGKEQSTTKLSVASNETKPSASKTSKVIKTEPKEEKDGFKWTLITHESGFVSAIGSDGKEIVPESLKMSVISYWNGYFCALGEERSCAIRKDGSIAVPVEKGYTYINSFDADKGYFEIGKGDKRGIISLKGSEVISLDQGYTIASAFSVDKGYLILGKDKKTGLYDMKGNAIIPYERGYSNIYTYSADKGFINVVKGNANGLCDIKGSEIISPERGYSSIYTFFANEGFIDVEKGDGKGVCDLKGNEIISPEKGYTAIETFNAKEGLIPVAKGDIKGLCDNKGREIISPEKGYTRINLFELEDGFIGTEKGEAKGLYDLKGRELIPTDRGYSIIRTDDAKKGYILVEKNNLWGVCKTNGVNIIPPVWSNILPERYGDFFVAEDTQGRNAVFSSDGKKIIPETKGYDIISVLDYGVIWCSKGDDIMATYNFKGKHLANRLLGEDEVTTASERRAERLQNLATVMGALGEALGTSSGSTYGSTSGSDYSYSSNSSGTAAYSRSYRDHGYHSALKIWRSFGNTVNQTESVHITEDNQGSLYLKVGGNYTLITPNSMKTFLGFSVSGYNYSAVYNDVHYFISIR